MRPTVGRIVHYTNLGDKDGRYPPETQAAIITGVYNLFHGDDRNKVPLNEQNSMECDLHIFYRSGQFDMLKVPYSETGERGHWSWPPKV